MSQRRARVPLFARCIPFVLTSFVLAAGATPLSAQATNFAAPFILQALGARAVGHGEAAVGDSSLGTEGIWWNPAAMARMRQREFGVMYAQQFLAKTAQVSLAYPSKALGTIGASAFILDGGDQTAKDSNNVELGTLTNRYYILSAAYASPMGKRFSAGVTAKRISVRSVCNGLCVNAIDYIGDTYALDLGTQYILPTKTSIVLGATVRNLGPKMQVRDRDQADPLPRIVQVGARAHVPLAALEKGGASLDVLGDVLSSPAYQSPSVRLGVDLSYQGLYALRAGYKSQSAVDGSEGGFTVGLGLKSKGFQLDLARRFDKSANFGLALPPTYVSLRVIF